MAEDEGEYSAYLTGSDDIKENEYEGGFKTWECAIDLANMVVQMCSGSSSGAEYGTVIEVKSIPYKTDKKNSPCSRLASNFNISILI